MLNSNAEGRLKEFKIIKTAERQYVYIPIFEVVLVIKIFRKALYI